MKILAHPEKRNNLFQTQAVEIKKRTVDKRVSDARAEVGTYYDRLIRVAKYGNHLPDWMKPDQDGVIMPHPGTPSGCGYKITKTRAIRKATSLFGYEPDDKWDLEGERYVRAFDEIISYWLPRPKSSE